MSDLALPVRVQVPLEQRLLRLGLLLALAVLLLGLVLPLGTLLLRAFEDADGHFVGLANFVAYVATPSLRIAAWNSLWTAALTTIIVVPLAFGFAYALTRSCIPGKGIFRAVMLLPVLAPSLLPALALIYLFGNQGMLRVLLFGESIYGPAGIVAAQVFYCFPHAALILAVALSTADARLYEAAEVLKAGRARIFATVTLPVARYGLVSASVVVFTLVVTDFGIPKVIGGQFPVLATDVYKQVVGLQNFNMGAVVGLVLLLPAIGAFLLDRWADGQRAGTLSGRAVPYVPKPRRARDLPLLALCLLVSTALVGIVGVAIWGSLVTFWPYNLTLTLNNYDFDRFDTAGWSALWTSVRIALAAAVCGTALVFTTAWLLERGAPGGKLGHAVRFIAGLPLAVPGLVLGLAFILFFNHPANPFGFLYGTLAILVLNGMVHFYTVMHLTAATAIRQLDPEFEAVGASLKVPAVVTFGRVTVPICLPAILDIAVYAFVNVMTTVSAVIFLYGPDTKPASVAVVHMDEAGQASAAAAMAVTILAVTCSVKLLQLASGGLVERLTQRWRRR
ncbi:putative 2-aminoethylphosphonate ABC transporter permease subunit [Falsiroseomonas selenitidurans]|uniref:2-aminoethylphosphonate ABC transporter permease subunit n=1 Tax=Falsiroseomonas selenitidurans TaxID=2716335 RepID=A0ABX1EBF3_9PROT|nr:putative 2-aminoethylphosphonate ABC transporter permease subunit [Falsiroseomonas selenitidurans]NKC33162.1 putative 2-aminoethylphosphonate ABC transporter permease subunit [Falsiroseomonas selenitidurans]